MNNPAPIGHNSRPEYWRDDESCEDLMKLILSTKNDPLLMEAVHFGYIHFFGDSYRNSDFSNVVRREVYKATGREIS